MTPLDTDALIALSPHCRVIREPPAEIYLISDADEVRLSGELFCDLAEFLDGSLTVAEITDRMVAAGTATAEEVPSAVGILRDRGYVVDAREHADASAPPPGDAPGNEPSSNFVSLVPDNPDWLGLVRVTADHGEGCSVVSKSVDKHARRRVDVSAVQISSDGSASLTLDRRYSRATLASCPRPQGPGLPIRVSNTAARSTSCGATGFSVPTVLNETGSWSPLSLG